MLVLRQVRRLSNFHVPNLRFTKNGGHFHTLSSRSLPPSWEATFRHQSEFIFGASIRPLHRHDSPHRYMMIEAWLCICSSYSPKQNFHPGRSLRLTSAGPLVSARNLCRSSGSGHNSSAWALSSGSISDNHTTPSPDKGQDGIEAMRPEKDTNNHTSLSKRIASS